MNEIASKGQLRLSYLRWALVTVAVVYPWAALHFYRASKSLLRDLDA